MVDGKGLEDVLTLLLLLLFRDFLCFKELALGRIALYFQLIVAFFADQRLFAVHCQVAYIARRLNLYALIFHLH